MTIRQESIPQNSFLERVGFDKVALAMSIVALLSISLPGSVMIGYGGAKFAPDFLIPVIGVCFFIFYSFIPIGTIFGLLNLLQEGVKHRIAMAALALNSTSIIIVYALYRLYD